MKKRRTIFGAALAASLLGAVVIYLLSRDADRAAVRHDGGAGRGAVPLARGAKTARALSQPVPPADSHPGGEAPSSLPTESEKAGAENKVTAKDDSASKDEEATAGAASPASPEDRTCLLALFDLNADSNPDVIVYERASGHVVQILLADGSGDFIEAPQIEVPEFLGRFLALAAEKGPNEGSILLRDDAGNEQELLLLGEQQ